LLFNAFLRADIGYDDQAVFLLIRPQNRSPAEDRRNLLTALSRNVKLGAIAAVAMSRLMLLHKQWHVFRWEDGIGCTAFQLLTTELSHADQCFVDKDDAKLVVNDGYPLVEFFQYVLHLAQPVGSLDVGVQHDYVAPKMPMNSRLSGWNSTSGFQCAPFSDVYHDRSTA
jgi:hypothetical protein